MTTKINDGYSLRVCARCEKAKPVDCFGIDRESKDGLADRHMRQLSEVRRSALDCQAAKSI
jgi:hypothetical protein